MNTKQTNQKAAKAGSSRQKKPESPLQNPKTRRFIAAGICAAIVLCIGAVIRCNTGSYALRHKVIAESEHYEVTAAMFACYFRQCADSYMRAAAKNTDLTVYDTNKSLKEQEYSNGVTWYDLFMDNAMGSVKQNLQLCEAAYAAGYQLDDEQEAHIREIAGKDDLSRYQKGVRLSDLEAATRLTILASEYKKDFKSKCEVTDEEVLAYYEANQRDYLTVSVLAYSFPWSPEGIITGDLTEHDAAVAAAEALGKCTSQQEFTEAVYRYLTDEKGLSREEAEQVAADLIITKTISEFPDAVREWVNGGAKAGETFVWPREDQCYASVYMLRDEPAADQSKTVDFRVIYLSAADFDGIENAVSFAEELRDETLAAEDTSAAFAELAGEYSEDAASYADGGLVAGYSASRTTYGDEVAAWVFDRERQHGDMTIVSRSGAAILVYFESANVHNGWENQVKNDLLQSINDAFTEACSAHEVKIKEKNYRFIKA